MAYSTQRTTSDGTLVFLDLALEYFDRSEIGVYFNGIVNAYPWAWVGTTDKRISFTPAIPAGIEVLVLRTTDLAVIRHKFSGGAAFTYETIDEDYTQILHIAQEARENAVITEVFQDFDLHGHKLLNLGLATESGDAVSLGQFQAHDDLIKGYRDAAATSAAASAASATASAQSAADAATAATDGINAAIGVTVQPYSNKTVLTDSTQTISNKRMITRVVSVASSATPSINTDNCDLFKLTAQAVDITSFSSGLTGTPNDGDVLVISITGTAARTITWGSSFEASSVPLPTTTIGTTMLTVGFIWNPATSKWRCVASV